MMFKYQFLFLVMLMLVILDGNEAQDCISKLYINWCGPWNHGSCNKMCKQQESRPEGGYCAKTGNCMCRACKKIKVTYYYNIYHMPYLPEAVWSPQRDDDDD